MKITYLFLNLICIAVLSPCAGQSSINDELKKINSSLSNFKSVQMKVRYDYYSSYSAKSPIETQRGVIRKKGDKQYSSLLGTETIINEKYCLTVDSTYKSIIVSEKPKGFPTKTLGDLDISKLLKQYETPTEVSNEKNAGFRFILKKGVRGEHKIVELYYNKKTYVVEKLVLFYSIEMPVDANNEDGPKDKPRLEISFYDINLYANLTDSDFSENKYVKVSNGKFTPQPTYKEFSIIKNPTGK